MSFPVFLLCGWASPVRRARKMTWATPVCLSTKRGYWLSTHHIIDTAKSKRCQAISIGRFVHYRAWCTLKWDSLLSRIIDTAPQFGLLLKHGINSCHYDWGNAEGSPNVILRYCYYPSQMICWRAIETYGASRSRWKTLSLWRVAL